MNPYYLGHVQTVTDSQSGKHYALYLSQDCFYNEDFYRTVVYEIEPGFLVKKDKKRLECGGIKGDHLQQSLPRNYNCVFYDNFESMNYNEKPSIEITTEGKLNYIRDETTNRQFEIPQNNPNSLCFPGMP